LVKEDTASDLGSIGGKRIAPAVLEDPAAARELAPHLCAEEAYLTLGAETLTQLQVAARGKLIRVDPRNVTARKPKGRDTGVRQREDCLEVAFAKDKWKRKFHPL
jgi:hypothetical protein